MSNNRNDREFTKKNVTTLAERAHFLCSNPNCRKMTTGPHSQEDKSFRTGEAAHIYSVSDKKARYNPDLSDEEVRDIKNGIWLCRDCHKTIDRDEQQYPAWQLFQWKKTHEEFVKALRSNPNSQVLHLINPTINEVKIATEILDYLNDRRALYNDFDRENPYHVYLSMQEMRKELLKKKQNLSKCFLSEQIDNMLKVIRQFLDTIYDIDMNRLKYGTKSPDWVKFENSLSSLRKVIGVIVFSIARNFSLNIGGDLIKIIPEE